jgi:outer membrane receptor protein involved in Fe transport
MTFRLLFCSAVLACLTYAQNPTATMVGVVRDQSGAVIAGVDLEIRNTDTAVSRKTVTNQRGEFTVPDLAPGPYEVILTHAGFRSVRQTDIVLEMDQVARMGFKLEVSAASQTIEVIEAGAPLVNTDNGTKGQVMTANEIVEMPLNGRNITDLGTLAAGITPNNTSLQGSPFAINGARPDNTNFIIDGFSSRESLFGGVLTSPNLDAMQEFKMQTNSFSAEYGRMAGGVMNMVLKSGTNQYHGTVFEFLRNDATDARNFFDVKKSELRQNQFGALISGPVDIPKIYHGRDRTFFLFSWESLREVSGSSATGLVATAAQEQGNFGTTPISDPLTTGTCPGSSGKGACFPNNTIPQSRLTPQALAIQKFMPLPNLSGINNLSSYAVSPTDFDSFIGKIDQRITEKDTLAFRITNRQTTSASPYTNPVAVGSNNSGLFGSNGSTHTVLAGLTYTHIFAPTLINEFRAAFNRTNSQSRGSFTGQGVDYDSQFGLPSSTTNPALVGFPQVNVVGYQQFGPSDAFPIIYYSNNWTPGDTLTWVKNNHLFKFGTDVLHTQITDPYGQNARGNYGFTGEWTGNSYADFLLGYLNSDGRLLGVNVNHLLQTSYGFFGEDDWKITPRLTLNLGLRYELDKPPQESADRWSNFVPALGKVVVASLSTLTGTGIGFTNPSLVTTARLSRFARLYPQEGLCAAFRICLAPVRRKRHRHPRRVRHLLRRKYSEWRPHEPGRHLPLCPDPKRYRERQQPAQSDLVESLPRPNAGQQYRQLHAVRL